MTRNDVRKSVTILAVLILAAFGCSRSIESKYTGKYFDVNNPSQSVEIFENGMCVVEAGMIRQFWGSVEGTTISLKLVSDMNPNDTTFAYPEFRGSRATLRIDGNTLITQNGRRFTKE